MSGDAPSIGESDYPLVQVGDLVKLTLPAEDGSTKMRGVVVRVKKAKSVKHKTRYIYSIKSTADDRKVKTRLKHLIWRKLNNKVLAIKEPKVSKMAGLDYRFILAPMVGASELAFRILCRRYGATLAYTPMINSERFATDPAYRAQEFQTTLEDRPLVAHFSANNPLTFLAAAKLVEKDCDAIDLNLGCPQRVAFAGHFGSFLLDQVDRPLVLDLVRTVSSGISIPLFVKIRLLDSVPETIELCRQLAAAGAALIAIHARYRVSLVGRSGVGARDGAAHLDQVKAIKDAMRDTGVPIIANGNVITFDDVMSNLALTGADGVMSAEGILDDPTLFFPQATGSKPTSDARKEKRNACIIDVTKSTDKLTLALEYLNLVDVYPAKIKTVVFHVRRMCRAELSRYQLLEDCVACTSVDAVRAIVQKALRYDIDGGFEMDQEKLKQEKDALERRKREEGKRKAYVDRMTRKAKREGKEDLHFYLSQGADPPSVDDLLELKKLPQSEAFELWKVKYKQHCYAFHFDATGCPRERTCAFLHMDMSYGDSTAYG